MLLSQLIIITNQVTSKNYTIWCGVWVVNNNKYYTSKLTFGNQTYIAWRQNLDSSTATSYQYYYMDVKAGESPKMIWISSMYSKPSVYGEPATYSGQTRYLMKTYIEEQTHHQ